MSKVWQQRIKHFSRALKPMNCVRLRKERRIRVLRERLGRPSRTLPLELVSERLQIALCRRLGAISGDDLAKRRSQLAFKEARSRLLEKKHNALRKIRGRRVGKQSSGINLWRRRVEFLADVEALRKRAAQSGEGPLVR